MTTAKTLISARDVKRGDRFVWSSVGSKIVECTGTRVDPESEGRFLLIGYRDGEQRGEITIAPDYQVVLAPAVSGDAARLVSTAAALRIGDVMEWPNRGDQFKVLELLTHIWADGGYELLVRGFDQRVEGLPRTRTMHFRNPTEPIRMRSFAPATDEDFKGL